MTSSKPVIAVRLDPAVHARVEKAAREQGRSPANLVAFELQKLYGGPESFDEKLDRAVGLAQKFEVRAKPGGIAAAVKRRPAKSK